MHSPRAKCVYAFILPIYKYIVRTLAHTPRHDQYSPPERTLLPFTRTDGRSLVFSVLFILRSSSSRAGEGEGGRRRRESPNRNRLNRIARALKRYQSEYVRCASPSAFSANRCVKVIIFQEGEKRGRRKIKDKN